MAAATPYDDDPMSLEPAPEAPVVVAVVVLAFESVVVVAALPSEVVAAVVAVAVAVAVVDSWAALLKNV